MKSRTNTMYAVTVVVSAWLLFGMMAGTAQAQSATSELTQIINPGTLSVDIVDGSYVSVPAPTAALTDLTFSFATQTSTGTLGTATEAIYVQNPDASDTGWNVNIAATGGATALWTNAAAPLDMDFNDATALTAWDDDGGDTDSRGGQLTIDASGATIANGNCGNCNTTGVTGQASAAFDEGVLDSITIISGAASSSDTGDWTATGISLSQTVPPEQPASDASGYAIDMTLSIVSI